MKGRPHVMQLIPAPPPPPPPRLTVLQRGGAVTAAPTKDVPSLLAGFLPLLLLCGSKAQCCRASAPSTLSPATARQGAGCGQPQGASLGLQRKGKELYRFQLIPTSTSGGETAVPTSSDRDAETHRGEGTCPKSRSR